MRRCLQIGGLGRREPGVRYRWRLFVLPAKPDDLFIAWCSDGTAVDKFHQSLYATMAELGAIIPWGALNGGPTVPQNRNTVVRGFLNTPYQWLLFLDDDMVFDPQAIQLLLATADAKRMPIVGGMACGIDEETREIRPTLYFWDETHEHPGPVYKTIVTWEPGKILKVDATGCACLLIHRSVFEKIDGKYGEAFPWFAYGTQGNGALPTGEDLEFCRRAREQGFPVFVHTGAKFGHRKSIVVSVDDYEMPEEAQ